MSDRCHRILLSNNQKIRVASEKKKSEKLEKSDLIVGILRSSSEESAGGRVGITMFTSILCAHAC